MWCTKCTSAATARKPYRSTGGKGHVGHPRQGPTRKLRSESFRTPTSSFLLVALAAPGFCHVKTRRPRFPPTNLCAFCAHCRQIHMVSHNIFLLLDHPLHKTFARKSNFPDLHREAFAEGNTKTSRSSPSYLNIPTCRKTITSILLVPSNEGRLTCF